MDSQLLPFMGTAVVIALTPGADTALVVRNASAEIFTAVNSPAPPT